MSGLFSELRRKRSWLLPPKNSSKTCASIPLELRVCSFKGPLCLRIVAPGSLPREELILGWQSAPHGCSAVGLRAGMCGSWAEFWDIATNNVGYVLCIRGLAEAPLTNHPRERRTPLPRTRAANVVVLGLCSCIAGFTSTSGSSSRIGARESLSVRALGN